MPKRKPRAAAGYRPYHGRRSFLRGTVIVLLVLLLLTGGLYCYARWVEPRLLKVERLTVENPLASDSLRIAVVADLHVGLSSGAQRVAQVTACVAKLRPDLVVFLGDLFDNYSTYSEGDEALLTEVLSMPALPAVRKYAVWGNHDVGGGAERIYPKIMEQAGWTLLKNENIQLSGNVNLIGADDLIWGEPNVQGLVREGAFNLLLCHEPDYGDQVTGVQLQLSAHTHGLQINLPFSAYRNMVAPPGGRHYLYGRYEKADGGIIYVTRGVGMSLMPYRFAAVPEITLVEVNP
jgi:Predicted phosphohydrolases